MRDIKDALLEWIRAIPVVDAHEHLRPEREHNRMHRDALSVYGQYTRLPMFASGMSQDGWLRMHDPGVALRERWSAAKPFIERIRHTSFARAARLTLQHFWKVTDLTDDNVEELSARIAAENQPGIYKRVLSGDCKIISVLNQDTSQYNGQDLEAYRGQEILRAVVALIDVVPGEDSTMNRVGGASGFDSLDKYLEWARQRLVTMAADGAVGFKTFSLSLLPPDRFRALEEFADIRKQARTISTDQSGPLLSYIHEELLRAAAPLRLPVAVHTGFWGVNKYNPAHMLPIIERHPNIYFDLFHSGVPYVRTMGSIAVNYANTSVNLCWAHSINASMTASALDEYIDQLGIDKIIAFGGDVAWMVEKIYGHLELARNNVASVLARRIENGLMDVDEARMLAKMWFFDNPARIYHLPIAND